MWKVSYFDDALEDLKKLDNSQRKQVLKAIDKVKTNPLPQNEGGYGKPLGNKRGIKCSFVIKRNADNAPGLSKRGLSGFLFLFSSDLFIL